MCVPLVSHARTHARGGEEKKPRARPVGPRPSLPVPGGFSWLLGSARSSAKAAFTPHTRRRRAPSVLGVERKKKKGSQDSVSPASFPPTSRRPVARGCLRRARAPGHSRTSLAYGGLERWVAAAVHVARRKAEAAPATRHGLPSKLIGTPH